MILEQPYTILLPLSIHKNEAEGPVCVFPDMKITLNTGWYLDKVMRLDRLNPRKFREIRVSKALEFTKSLHVLKPGLVL